MDVVTILQNVPLSIAIVIVVLVLGRLVLDIIKILAQSRAKRIDAETDAIKLKSQTDIEIARLDAEARTKIAEAELEKAKTVSAAQKETIAEKAKLATELDTHRTQSDAVRQSTLTSLEATTHAQLETVKILARLATGQKGTDTLVRGSEKRLTASGSEHKETLSAAIREVMQAIIKLAGDQSIAMTTMQEFLQELSDKLDDPSVSEVMIADVSVAAVNTIVSAVAGTAPTSGAATEGGEGTEAA